MKVSAGCVVLKKLDDDYHMLLVHSAGNWYNKKMGIPKGEVEDGEDPINAAIRETKEETGITVKILSYLTEVEKKDKKVLVYISTYKSGEIENKKAVNIQKSEIDFAKFYTIEEAKNLIYDYQIPIIEKTLEYLKNNNI